MFIRFENYKIALFLGGQFMLKAFKHQPHDVETHSACSLWPDRSSRYFPFVIFYFRFVSCSHSNRKNATRSFAILCISAQNMEFDRNNNKIISETARKIAYAHHLRKRGYVRLFFLLLLFYVIAFEKLFIEFCYPANQWKREDKSNHHRVAPHWRHMRTQQRNREKNE